MKEEPLGEEAYVSFPFFYWLKSGVRISLKKLKEEKSCFKE